MPFALLGGAGLAVGLGWLIAAGAAKLVLAGAASMLLIAAIASSLQLSGERRLRRARLFGWIGLFGPLALTQARTAASVGTAQVSTINLLQIAIPLISIGAVFVIGRPAFVSTSLSELGLWAYGAAAVLSAGWSAYPTPTLLKAGQLCLAYALLSALLRCGDLNVIFQELAGWLYTLAGSTVVGLLLVPRRAWTIQQGFYASDSDPHRLTGVFPAMTPDEVGLVAGSALVLLLARLGPRWALRRNVRWLLLALSLASLVLSRSRTGVVIVLVGVFVVALADQRKRATSLGAALALLAVVAVVFLSGLGGPAVGNLEAYVLRGQTQAQAQGLTGRTAEWSVALQLWRQHPMSGRGYYTGHRLSSTLQTSTTSEVTNLDNTWLDTLVDLGILGVIPLAMALMAAMKRLISSRFESRTPILALASATLVASFVSPTLELPNYELVTLGIVVLGVGRLTRPHTARNSDGEVLRGVGHETPSDWPNKLPV